MYLQVKVSPKSRATEFIELMDDGTYKFRLKAAPEKGKANEELIEFLSEALNISKEEIKIISGHTDRNKLLKIPDNSVLPWS